MEPSSEPSQGPGRIDPDAIRKIAKVFEDMGQALIAIARSVGPGLEVMARSFEQLHQAEAELRGADDVVHRGGNGSAQRARAGGGGGATSGPIVVSGSSGGIAGNGAGGGASWPADTEIIHRSGPS